MNVLVSTPKHRFTPREQIEALNAALGDTGTSLAELLHVRADVAKLKKALEKAKRKEADVQDRVRMGICNIKPPVDEDDQ